MIEKLPGSLIYSCSRLANLLLMYDMYMKAHMTRYEIKSHYKRGLAITRGNVVRIIETGIDVCARK